MAGFVKSSDPAPRGDAPGAIAVDSAGNVLFTGDDNEVLARAGRTGTFYGIKMRAGGIYRVAGGGAGSASDGLKNGIPAIAAVKTGGGFNADGIAGLTIDAARNLVVADKANLRVRVIAKWNGTFYGGHMSAGLIYTIARNGKLGTSHRCTGRAAGTEVQPNGVATDNAGDLAVSGPIGGQGHLWIDAGKTRQLFGRRLIAGHVSVLLRCQRPKTTCVQVKALAVVDGSIYGVPMRAGQLFTIAG